MQVVKLRVEKMLRMENPENPIPTIMKIIGRPG
jgi:hypothetical protein